MSILSNQITTLPLIYVSLVKIRLDKRKITIFLIHLFKKIQSTK